MLSIARGWPAADTFARAGITDGDIGEFGSVEAGEAMISIRYAKVADAAGIAHVHVESWRTAYADILPSSYLDGLNADDRTVLWRDWLSRDIEVFLSEEDGRINGFISGGAIREPVQSCDAELFAIYLLKEAQGQGIGTALLGALAESMAAKDYKSMAVWVLEQNPCKRFYAKSGAREDRSKEIEIGGANLTEVAYWWPDLRTLCPLG